MFTIYENNEPEPIFSPFTYTRGIKKNPSQCLNKSKIFFN